MELPKSKKTFDAEIADTVKDQMDVEKAGGKRMQGLINRRSREKDVFDGVNPVFPELSEGADLNTAQKYAALNLLLEVESSGGTKTSLEKIGNTVGKYHIKQDKAALVDPRIKKMSSSQFKKYIKSNPDKEEELVSGYLDVEINKMLDRTGVDRNQLNPNEYAAVVSNLYNKGNQPELLKNTAKLTQFRQKAFPKTAEKTQNINQDAPIQDVGKDIPMDEQGVERFKTKKSTDELGLFPVERVEDVPDKPKRSFLGFEFNEGGAVPMQKQMEMFNDGGLMDEGGSVDPVSGNDVPPGSTQEEVRDDIPAQLSEGEFVFPADVVRYIGLGNLMTIRQEAKMGLKMMDEMGQMGNSEEATMPDDLPFDINDLDMEDEDEYNTRQEFAVGGMPTPNSNTGVYYNPAAIAPTTGVAAVPQQAASQQYIQPVRPQQATVPTMQAYKPSEIPTFTQTIGSTPGQYDELREYKNESGEVRQIPFKAGQPIYPIPEGFTYVDPEATKTEEVTTTPTDVKTQTTRVREEQTGGEDRDSYGPTDEEKYGRGGGRLGVGGTIYGVSFDGVNIKNITGFGLGLATGKPIPDGVNITMQTPSQDGTPDIFTLTPAQYNKLKNTIDNTPGGANSTKVVNMLDGLKSEGRARHSVDTHIKNMSSFTDSKEMKNVLDTYRDNMEKQIEVGNVKEDGSIINPFEMPGARGGGSDTGFAGTKGSQQRASESDTTGSETSQTIPDVANPPDPVGPDRGPQTGGGPSQDDAPASDGSEQQSDGYGGLGHATGGLISKPKPKVKKKMKRGGLASKK